MRQCVLFVLSLSVCVFGGGVCGIQPTVLAQTAVPAQAGGLRVELAGHIRDSNGNPVAEADIQLVAGVDFATSWLRVFDDKHGRIRALSDSLGHFRIGFDHSDAQFMVPGDSTLVVKATGFQQHVVPVPIERMLSNAPFDIDLVAEEVVKLRVLTPDLAPLPDAKVCVAAVRGVDVPWCTVNQSTLPTTDVAGDVALQGTSADSIGGVFVTHQTIGQQRVAVVFSDSGLLMARLAPTRGIHGRIESPDRSPIPGIADIQLLVRSVSQDAPFDSGWTCVPVGENGAFRIPQLKTGSLTYAIRCPEEFPWRGDGYGLVRLPGDPADKPWLWQLEFQRQPRAVVTVLDDRGNPLPNIHISMFDGRTQPTLTDAAGKASFFRTGTRSSYFPTDATGRYFSADGFYQYAKDPPVDGVVEFPPIRLTRSSSWHGKVVDEAGEGVGGVAVRYKFSRERFQDSVTVFTNDDGTFSLVNVDNMTAVRLRAMAERHASEEKHTLLPLWSGMELRLTPQPVAHPTGQLVDLSGIPVVGASVAIFRAEVVQTESHSSEFLTTAPLYTRPETVRTDANGGFRFPLTQSRGERVRIEVQDPRYFHFASPYVDASNQAGETAVDVTDSDENVAYLGQFRLMRRPNSVRVGLHVVSVDQQAVPEAEILLVGARIDKVSGKTNAAGRFDCDVQGGPCVLAVRAAGYHVFWSSFDAGHAATANGRGGSPAVQQVVLHPNQEPVRSLRQTDSIFVVNRAAFDDAADALFSQWTMPDPNRETPYRIGLYLDALAATSPDRFAEFLMGNQTNMAVIQAAASGAMIALQTKPELIEVAASSGSMPADAATGFWLIAANATPDGDQQIEWIGEALVAASDPYAKASCVSALLMAGEFDLAREVAADIWENANELQELVAGGTRKQSTGDARLIAPTVALNDLDLAWKLIELTGAGDEIGWLKTQAALNWGMIHQDLLVAKLSEDAFTQSVSGAEFDGGVSRWTQMMAGRDRLGFEGFRAVVPLAARIEDAPSRAAFLLFNADLSHDPSLCAKLVKLAAAAIRQVDPGADMSTFQYELAQSLTARSVFAELAPEELDAFIFDVLWQLPLSAASDRQHALLAAAAHVLAYRDRSLARVLLEPALQDRGWMFGRTSYERDAVIASVAHIDPSWAIEIAHSLDEQEFRNSVVDRLEIRSVLIRELLEPKRRSHLAR